MNSTTYVVRTNNDIETDKRYNDSVDAIKEYVRLNDGGSADIFVEVNKEKLEELLERLTDAVAYMEHSDDLYKEQEPLYKNLLSIYDLVFDIAGDEFPQLTKGV